MNIGRNCSCYEAQVVFRLEINIWDRDVNVVMASDHLWAEIQNNKKKKHPVNQFRANCRESENVKYY